MTNKKLFTYSVEQKLRRALDEACLDDTDRAVWAVFGVWRAEVMA